jgi:hypothetical protein
MIPPRDPEHLTDEAVVGILEDAGWALADMQEAVHQVGRYWRVHRIITPEQERAIVRQLGRLDQLLEAMGKRAETVWRGTA